MVEKRGAEPKRLETRPGEGRRNRPWLLGRVSSQLVGPRRHRGGAQTDNRKEPRHHPATLGTSLQRLTHRPGGPPGAPFPERSTSARSPSSAPARDPRSSDVSPNAAGRASPEPGPRGVGPRFERANQTENPEESFRISLVVVLSGFQPARKRPWLHRAGEDRAPQIAGAGCGEGVGGECDPRTGPRKCSVFSRHPEATSPETAGLSHLRG